MISNLFNDKDRESFVSEFKDPFNKECVYAVWFWIRKDFYGKPTYSAEVEFRNGNTRGKQEIKADNFIDLVKKTEDFIKSL